MIAGVSAVDALTRDAIAVAVLSELLLHFTQFGALHIDPSRSTAAATRRPSDQLRVDHQVVGNQDLRFLDLLRDVAARCGNPVTGNIRSGPGKRLRDA